MTYRDELEAALQRANALEREVAALRELARVQPALQAQVEALQRQLQTANEKIQLMHPPEELSPEAKKELGRGAIVFALILPVGIIVLLILGLVFGVGER